MTGVSGADAVDVVTVARLLADHQPKVAPIIRTFATLFVQVAVRHAAKMVTSPAQTDQVQVA